MHTLPIMYIVQSELLTLANLFYSLPQSCFFICTMTKRSHQDLHLESIDRNLLDFDLAPICSQTSQTLHVYACLVCGSYFSGKSSTSPAYSHAITTSHAVFINLATTDVWILPDNYAVDDVSLNDIKRYLKPTFDKTTDLSISRYNLQMNPFFQVV